MPNRSSIAMHHTPQAPTIAVARTTTPLRSTCVCASAATAALNHAFVPSRMRRRARSCGQQRFGNNNNNNNTSSSSSGTLLSSLPTQHSRMEAAPNRLKMHETYSHPRAATDHIASPTAAMPFFWALLHRPKSTPNAALLVVLQLALLVLLSNVCLSRTGVAAASSVPCASHSWWDPLRDKCIPCTACKGEMIPLRPCQLHRDTICGSIYDLKIDWYVLAKTEPNWKERRKVDETAEFMAEPPYTHEQLQQLQEESLPLDWQTTALFLAVLACLLFFIVAACILIHHMRQWRRMERRLDQDVEELSTKLMAKLVEVQTLEGGTFFIGNADALHVPTTFQPQHVLLPKKTVKQQERRVLKTMQPGNVYIEENGSKG